MKNLLLLIVVLLLSFIQASAKTIYGNFIFDNQLVAYEFSHVDPVKNYYQLKFYKIIAASESNRTPEPKILDNLNDLQLANYKTAIKSLIDTLFKGSEELKKPKELDLLATRLFYELKNRMEFEDARPVTGVMYLISDQIQVYPSGKVEEIKKRDLKNEVTDLKLKYALIDNNRKKFNLTTDQNNDLKERIHNIDSLTSTKPGLIFYPTNKRRSEINSIKYYLNQLIDTTDNVLDPLKVKKVEIQFADGGFNNILVETIRTNETNPNNVIKFRNNIPISISGKFDPEKFVNHKIFYDGASGGEFGSGKNSFINLNELIRYDIRLENNKEDYSPADTIITLTPNMFSSEVSKDKTSKILSARTFTDIVGIDEQQPNGLIQLEVYRKFNLITSRKQGTAKTYNGWFSYIQPMFALTKIEENKRYLPINNFPNLYSGYIVNPIEILRYQQFNFGFDLNFYSFNIPNFKSKLFLDLHYDLGRTTLAFNESETSDILTRLNYSTYGPTLYYQILPDSRFGFKTGYDARKQSIHGNFVSLPENEQSKLSDERYKWYGTYWFLGNFRTSPSSELFFRFRYHHRFFESESNFLEIQLGAAFDIIRNK